MRNTLIILLMILSNYFASAQASQIWFPLEGPKERYNVIRFIREGEGESLKIFLESCHGQWAEESLTPELEINRCKRFGVEEGYQLFDFERARNLIRRKTFFVVGKDLAMGLGVAAIVKVGLQEALLRADSKVTRAEVRVANLKSRAEKAKKEIGTAVVESRTRAATEGLGVPADALRAVDESTYRAGGGALQLESRAIVRLAIVKKAHLRKFAPYTWAAAIGSGIAALKLAAMQDEYSFFGSLHRLVVADTILDPGFLMDLGEERSYTEAWIKFTDFKAWLLKNLNTRPSQLSEPEVKLPK